MLSIQKHPEQNTYFIRIVPLYFHIKYICYDGATCAVHAFEAQNTNRGWVSEGEISEPEQMNKQTFGQFLFSLVVAKQLSDFESNCFCSITVCVCMISAQWIAIDTFTRMCFIYILCIVLVLVNLLLLAACFLHNSLREFMWCVYVVCFLFRSAFNICYLGNALTLRTVQLN